MQTASGVICAELIREFLEFYRLDYTSQIYLPEVNLAHQKTMSKDELSRRAGLGQDAPQMNKPLLMQVLEGFLAGDHAAAQPAA
jgi:hypothetical protein